MPVFRGWGRTLWWLHCGPMDALCPALRSPVLGSVQICVISSLVMLQMPLAGLWRRSVARPPPYMVGRLEPASLQGRVQDLVQDPLAHDVVKESVSSPPSPFHASFDWNPDATPASPEQVAQWERLTPDPLGESASSSSLPSNAVRSPHHAVTPCRRLATIPHPLQGERVAYPPFRRR